MSTMQEIMNRLDQIESKLNKLLPPEDDQLDQINGYAVRAIEAVERYISRSGNVTWKAFDTDGIIVYLRQSHRDMLEAAELWSLLNKMADGDMWNTDFVVETIPDGDFHKPAKIHGGRIFQSSVKTDYTPATEEWKPGTDVLNVLLDSGDFVVLDTETTDLNGYICQIAILGSNGEFLLNKLIQPPAPISLDASRVHGITDEKVTNAPTLPQIAEELADILNATKTIVGWNMSFDIKALKKSTGAYTLPRLAKVIKDVAPTDLMLPFAEIYGEWSNYHGNYKYQKLTTAARHYGISTQGAHSAIDDCRMTLAVMQHMAKEAQQA